MTRADYIREGSEHRTLRNSYCDFARSLYNELGERRKLRLHGIQVVNDDPNVENHYVRVVFDDMSSMKICSKNGFLSISFSGEEMEI